MSTDFLIFMPTMPEYIPKLTLAEQAKRLLQTLVPQPVEVTTYITKEVEFIATGGNLDKITCPFCQSVLDEQWWNAAMDRAYTETKFADLTVTLPCCGNVSSLNDLCYDWPTGFARFQLIAREPGQDIEEEALRELERVLACPLRKIWAHF